MPQRTYLPRPVDVMAAARQPLVCLRITVSESERVWSSTICGELELVDETANQIIDVVPAPIAVVFDNGPCVCRETCQAAFAGDDPQLRHVRTHVRSPQTNGVIERFFGSNRP